MVNLSARWVLTVMCGIAFVEIVTADFFLAYHGREPMATMVEKMLIITIVVNSYFLRSDRKKGDEPT